MTFLWKRTETKLSALMSRAKQIYKDVNGAMNEIPFKYGKQIYTVLRYGAHLHVYDWQNRKVGVRRV